MPSAGMLLTFSGFRQWDVTRPRAVRALPLLFARFIRVFESPDTRPSSRQDLGLSPHSFPLYSLPAGHAPFPSDSWNVGQKSTHFFCHPLVLFCFAALFPPSSAFPLRWITYRETRSFLFFRPKHTWYCQLVFSSFYRPCRKGK